jgi:hypothetical protein
LTAGADRSRRILVLSGGLIHLVHQLAAVCSLPAVLPPARIAVLITGVLNRNPAALAALQDTIDTWFQRLRQDSDGRLAGLELVRQPGTLLHQHWDLVCLNNQWQTNQREWMERLDIPELLVCGDGLGLYYRCARELRAVLPSLLGLPIRESGREVRYVLSGRQPCWHRPPISPQPVPLAERRRLFALLVDSLRGQGIAELATCLRVWAPDRPLWLCSVPNLAHQFPEGHIAPGILEHWRRHLQRHHGFSPDLDRLLLIDHPKAPPDGSFGVLHQPWLAGPLRSSLPLEVLIALLGEARPQDPIHICGMTSALYGVSRLTAVPVVWLPLRPLWRHNPNYRRRPLEFLHRSLRLARMALLTSQNEADRGGGGKAGSLPRARQ